MVLFLHNRYRTPGGEERVVRELAALVREHLGETAEVIERDSAALERGAAALGMLRGGLREHEVAEAVRRTGARVLHAHNLHPSLGWRSLAAARGAGARVVLHLHQYRLVCAVGVCFTRGAQCTRCHGVNTLPGVLRNCRGGRAEALVYGASLALWQRRLLAQADAVVVPSRHAERQLRDLGAPLPPPARVHVLAPPVPITAGEQRPTPEPPTPLVEGARQPKHAGEQPDAGDQPGAGGYALVASRLAPEKGVEVAIDACRIVGMPLVIAGDGPLEGELRERAAGADVRFAGRVDERALARLRAGATLALCPSRSAETFGMAAAEAMAAGVPVLASDVGALRELLEARCLVAPGDPRALAEAIGRLAGDREAAAAGLARVRELCAPARVAERLGRIYDGVAP